MVDAVPDVPITLPATANRNIKPATPDLIQFNDADIPIEFMSQLMFEDIGGQEIISISRNDIVNGQKVTYSPIKNLSALGLKYNAYNIFSIPTSSQSQFNNFAIKLENHTPIYGQGTGKYLFPTDANLEKRLLRENVYVDPPTGDLIINVVNLSDNEQVEIEVVSTSESFNDILY